MKFRKLLTLYLMALLVMVTVPLGNALNDIFIFELRLDYLVHVLVFTPVVVLWRLGFPAFGVEDCGVGVLLAVGLEGVQYGLPYRSWNMNDAVGNAVGVGVGVFGFGYWTVETVVGSVLRYCAFEKRALKSTITQG